MRTSDALARYERQIEYVQAIVSQYPHCIDELDASDQGLFKKYFQPDWEVEDNFLRYYEQLTVESPEWEVAAGELLEEFLEVNGLHHKPDLL